MNTFRLDIVTPERRVLSEDVEMLKLCLPDGEYVLLAGHEPVTAAVDYGLVSYRSAAGETHELLVADGFAQMQADRAFVFTDQCLDADDLDREQEKLERRRMIEKARYDESLLTHHSAGIFLARAITSRKRRRTRLK
ncbi:MAG: F0F1 ATP synthase subunit epsilon [Clostridia bacterium]|nr:F0F1 ATP synthase subunit epsilon [Clostridia bacterium]